MKPKNDSAAARPARTAARRATVVKDAPVGLVRLDEAGLVLAANRHMADLLGITDGSLNGFSIVQFLTDGSRTPFRYYLEELLVSGEERLSELTFLKRDGTRVRTIIRSSVRKTKAGAVIEAAIIHLGNSACEVPALPDESLKGFADNMPDAILRLIETEHSFRDAIGRSLSIGIGAIDDEGKQIYVNPAFCRIVGWSSEELLGRQFPYVYWPQEELRKAVRIFIRIRRNKKISGSFEVTLQRRDGTRFDALIMYSAFYDNSGRRIGWIGSVGDISGLKRKEAELQRLNRDLDVMVRKRTESLRTQNRNLRDILMGLNRAQEELRLSETRVLLEKQRLETILNVVPAGVVVVEGREGQMAFINRIAQGFFGRKPQPDHDMVDNLMQVQIMRPDGEMYPPDELPLNRSLLNGETVRGEEMAIVRPDGQMIPVLANTTPFVIGGEIVGAVGSFIDITKVKRSEESIRTLNTELEKNLQLVEDTNKELEAFVHSVTHDIRSPLVVINGFSRRLLELPPDGFAEKSQDYIEYIRETSQNALFLVRDLLRLFKIARGEINRTTVDIAQMALSLQQYFRGLYPGRTVRMIARDDVRVSGDHSLLKIVMENLIGNAYKFTARNDGEAMIEVGSYQAKEDLIVYVRDNGCGFDMARASRLFQPFARFHDENEYKGTGIGLATVKRIIHRHGGRIWADSQPGMGATFYFTLPE